MRGAGQGSPGPLSHPYSPEYVEGGFSEVRQEFIGNSSPLASVAHSADAGRGDLCYM